MVSTRSRSRNVGSPAPGTPDRPPTPQTVSVKPDVPPTSPDDRGLASVTPPLQKTSTATVIYAIAFIAFAFLAFYSYHAASGVSPAVRDTRPTKGSFPSFTWLQGWRVCQRGDGDVGREGALSVESHIEALAQALGVPSPDLAVAIASVVKEYVPPASLSSAASEARRTGGSLTDKLLGKGKGRGTPVGRV